MARLQVLGTDGDDVLNEGPQASSDIFGFGGADQIFLNRSDDLGGDNFVDAGDGDDQVLNRFEGGNEILLGAGNDTYVGLGFAIGTGFDVVRGGDGNDTIAVSTFQSEYFGGNGADRFFSVGWQNEFFGGTGRDTISYQFRDEDSTLGGSGVGVDLAAGRAFTGGIAERDPERHRECDRHRLLRRTLRRRRG
jgi:serralysin